MPIALLTDFGTSDYFVGAMKGVILSIAPIVPIVDISHHISPQDISEATFVLEACYRDFPEGTIFVAVVDPGVGSNRKPLLAASSGFYFVGPDNGIFSFLFDEGDRFSAFEITNQQYMASSRSGTFDGRDIFAPAAANLAMGAAPDQFGPPVESPVVLPAVRPRRITETETIAQIRHIDHFGNIITNLRPADLSEKFKIAINGQTIERMRQCYADAEPGEIFAIAGSSGLIEIAVREGSAQSELGVNRGDEVTLVIDR